MEKETLKNIFNFIEKLDGTKIPFLWKITNGSPLTKEDLIVNDDLDLSNFKITSLPEGLKVSGNLNLDYSKITSLPEDLEVGGELSLEHSNIKSLPELLKVGGDLDLYGCEKLESLPEGLKVNGTLYLNHCYKLQSLPKGLKVDDGINITYTKLTKYTETQLKKMVKPGYIKGIILNEDPDWDETEFAI
jgi:hypothetical protein